MIEFETGSCMLSNATNDPKLMHLGTGYDREVSQGLKIIQLGVKTCHKCHTAKDPQQKLKNLFESI